MTRITPATPPLAFNLCYLPSSQGYREKYTVSNPDADHIGGFLDVFDAFVDAFEVETIYVSGDPEGTLTHNSFLRGAQGRL
jgi:hypothetical protein